MSKKILSICLSVLLVFCMTATLSSCGSEKSENAEKYGYEFNNAENMLTFISSQAESTSADLTAVSDALIEKLGSTFDSYSKNKGEITAFYEKSLAISDSLQSALKAVTVDYYKYTAKNLSSDYTAWTSAMDDVYDAWTDAFEDFYDTWNDSFKDIYKICNKLIKLGYNKLPYKEYSDLWSDMYDEYSDAWSDMYDKHSDNWNNLYDTQSDVWSALYDGEKDLDSILNTQADEKETEDKNSNNTKPSNKPTDQPTTEKEEVKPTSKTESESVSLKANSIKDLETKIIEETEKSVSALESEYEAFASNITTYQKYVDNLNKVKSFYQKINNTFHQLSVKLYKYSLSYAEMIMKSDMSNDEKYDALDGIYDTVYEDAGDILYDKIYDGVLDDMYDDFYSGVVSDGADIASYDHWSKVLSNEYELWSDTRSDCYEEWSDMRSDIYDFCSDMRSKIYKGDTEKAQKVIDDFKEDIEKLK